MEKISRTAPLSTFDIVYVKKEEIVLFHIKEGHLDRHEVRMQMSIGSQGVLVFSNTPYKVNCYVNP